MIETVSLNESTKHWNWQVTHGNVLIKNNLEINKNEIALDAVNG